MRKFLLTAIAMASIASVNAQYIPSHDKYVEDLKVLKEGVDLPAGEKGERKERFYEYFKQWQPGVEVTEDDNFYISRVKIKERFVNTATQVDPKMTQDRKFCLWTPMGISDTYWQTLPRYVLDGDNFGMWSYLDYQGGWSLPWVRVPGSFSDVAHKNGVTNGCLIFIDSWGGDNTEASRIINMLVEKDGSGNFIHLDKFIKFLKYYGVDGVGVNPEGTVPNANLLQQFFAKCFKRAPELNWHFHVYWYGTNTNNGGMDLGSDFGSGKSAWFRDSSKGKVTDMYMLNYNWHSSLTESANYADAVGGKGASYDIYAGLDIQGKWLGYANWKTIANNPVSVAFWGNHTTDMIYQNSTENGSGDEAVQYCYLTKQEQVFSGGNRNPALTPDILETGTQNSSEAAMKKFHGMAKLMPARSTLQELPFVTYFNLGNGKTFRKDGEVTFDQKWYNIGVQDYLPTWRWWITDAEGNALSYYGDKVIDCSFTFDDAWYGGSSMQFSGETETSVVRLFKTKFSVTANSKVSLVYKIADGTTESHMKLFWSFVGSETEFHEKEIPAVEKIGEWKKVTFLASQIGMSGDKEVAMIGLRFDNTEANYKVLIGEFSIIPSTGFNPVKPQITKSEILKRTYNSLDFKLIWKSKDQDATKLAAGEPVYNEEVDTWLFEVYCQPKDGDAILCGTTTSWAHYVVGAPSLSDVEEYKFGVCALAPDGKTRSEIAWTDYMQSEKTLVKGIELDKNIIKVGEEFVVKYKDPNYPEAFTWRILKSETSVAMGTPGSMSTSYKAKLNSEGYYDVEVRNNDNTIDYYRGYIQVSSDEVGGIPKIKDFTADKQEINKGETVNISYSSDYLGEGTVSRGLEITDPNIFMVNKEVLTATQCGRAFSIAVWVRPSKFAHSKYGINLINKRNTQIGWPHNNWGQFWVHVWPGTPGLLDDNIVSYTMYHPDSENLPSFNGNPNKHEIPNLNCCTYVKGASYPLSLNTWSHIIISYDGSNQRIFFNGKLVGGPFNCTFNQYDECPIYFGGSNVYHTGFTGTIDEVQIWHKAITTSAEAQQAMAGYKEGQVPAELKGYYTFEDYNPETFAFKNIGSLGSSETYDGYYIMQEGTGGENTQGAKDTHVAANNSVTGNPALSGTLDIKTTASFSAGGYPIINPTENGANVTFPNDGTFDVTLTLSNAWGSDTMTKTEYIVVGTGVGIEDEVVEDLGVYPNPFIDAVNVVFATEGNYTVSIFTVDGNLCYSQNVVAMENEVKRIGIDGESGMYLMQVVKDGKIVKTVKVNKQ